MTYAVALFIPAIECGVYCMLLWPPQSSTSPNSTSASAAVAPPAALKPMVCGVLVAACGGSCQSKQ